MSASEVDANIEVDGTKVVANLEFVHIEAVAIVNGIGTSIPTCVVIDDTGTCCIVEIERSLFVSI